METSATYQSFAKINLYLGVLNRRRDGYHNIETVFQSVSLADRLEFVERNIVGGDVLHGLQSDTFSSAEYKEDDCAGYYDTSTGSQNDYF